MAAQAAMKFAAQGFPVKEMDGGFEVWKEKDLPIENCPPNRGKTRKRKH
jgi:hypothetical protein